MFCRNAEPDIGESRLLARVTHVEPQEDEGVGLQVLSCLCHNKEFLVANCFAAVGDQPLVKLQQTL